MPNIKTIPNGFDYFGFYETPEITLCAPNKKPLFSLAGLKNRALDLKLNGCSTFGCTALPSLKGQDLGYFDKLQANMLIKIEDIGYFIIKSMQLNDDGIMRTKDIEAYSLEYEFTNKQADRCIAKGTYKFYDIVKPEDTLMGLFIKAFPSWSIGDIDPDLLNKYRYYEPNSQNMYHFLMNTVQDTLSCVFTFDTFKKTISAYSVKNITTPTSIYMSHNNLIKDLKVEEVSDSLFTALEVTGGDGLEINLVNPLGNNMIYDFSYYKNTDWMSEELITAINKWEKKCADKKPEFETNAKQYREKVEELYGTTKNVNDYGVQGELTTKKAELKGLEEKLSLAVSTKDSAQISQLNNEMDSIRSDIKKLERKADNLKADIKKIEKKQADIASSLSFKNNFEGELYDELSLHIRESVYNNPNCIQTDRMTPAQILNQQNELYEQALSVLKKVSKPKYSFEVNSLNFVFLEKFKPFSDQLKLGSEITVELKEDITVQPILLELKLNYDSPTDFSMVFGNRTKLDTPEQIFADMFGQAVLAGNQVALNSGNWNSFHEGYKSKVTEFMDSALDASKNNIITSDKQSFVIDNVGIRGREHLANGEFDPCQIWINNNMIAFTKDNWKTASLAIGKMNLNGSQLFGVLADALVGKILIGDQLVISNENNSFVVDANGATLTDAKLTVNTTDGKHKIVLDPESGLTIEEIIQNGVTKKVFYADTNGNLTLKGNIYAEDGTFKGVLQARQYLDSAGNSMMNGKEQFTADYLDVRGLNVNNNFIVNENGEVTINNGHIKFGSVDGLDDAIDEAKDVGREAKAEAREAKSEAREAEIIAKKIANGEYSGTFIDGKKIYSPTIYGNEFNVITKKNKGGWHLWGDWSGEQRHFLQVLCWDAGDHPLVWFHSPLGAYLTFAGTVDFTSATVKGLNTNATFG
nr:MAG TPA: tail protein [Caudoviricetes sp.]